jgi:hypothetical protein
MYGGVEIQLHTFLNTTLNCGDWLAHSAVAYFGEKVMQWENRRQQAKGVERLTVKPCKYL